MTTRSPTLLSVRLSDSLSFSFPLDECSLPASLIHSVVSPRRLPAFASHPRASAALRARASYTLLPAYRRGVLAASHATYRDCLAAFTRRLLTGGRYSGVPYYAFVRGRFSSRLPRLYSSTTDRTDTTERGVRRRCVHRRATGAQEPKAVPRESVRASSLPSMSTPPRVCPYARSMGTWNRPVFRDTRILTRELLAS